MNSYIYCMITACIESVEFVVERETKSSYKARMGEVPYFPEIDVMKVIVCNNQRKIVKVETAAETRQVSCYACERYQQGGGNCV